MEKTKTYEGMFLLPSGGGDLQAASAPIADRLARIEAEVLSLKPWEDRRLAYEIKGHRRALYVLAYFNAEPDRIAELERDCRLDEQILRVLVLQKDRVTDEMIQADTPALTAAAKAAARAAEQAAARAAEQAADEPPAEPVAPVEPARETPEGTDQDPEPQAT